MDNEILTKIFEDRPFLTFDEASRYLGLSKNTLYTYTSKSLIPSYKVQGRKLYFKIADLNSFVLDKKNLKPVSKLHSESLTLESVS